MRPLPLVLLVLSACEAPVQQVTPSDTGMEVLVTSPPPAAPRSDPSVDGHPCGADGAAALLWDGPLTAWLGCRSAGGLWLTRDGGTSWEEPATDPPHRFGGRRVSHLSRSADLLHVVADDQVFALDGAGRAQLVLLGSDGFAPASFARGGSGVSAVGSVGGADVAYRFNDRAAFGRSDRWGPAEGRMGDLLAWGDRFYGVGSVASAPVLYLDPDGGQQGALGFRLHGEPLPDVGRGELVALDLDGGGLVAVGVDTDREGGVILTTGPDPADLEAWRTFHLGIAWAGEPSALFGACRADDRVVAVGQLGEEPRGLVLLSEDAGRTWTDVTPEDLPPLQRCGALSDGSLAVAGADGVFARWELAAP